MKINERKRTKVKESEPGERSTGEMEIGRKRRLE
jgi:hypothetical protein